MPEFFTISSVIFIMEILTPPPLKHGDRIAILSPASIIKPQVVYSTLPILTDMGWVAYVGENTFGRHGTYAGTDDQRYRDLENALTDPDTRAIICARGGYGAVHLLEKLNKIPLRNDPKWIVGYSDISALHALMSSHGIKSIHAPMTKHIAEHHGNDEDSRRLFALLRGETPDIRVDSFSKNRCGSSEGILLGGNLAVIAGLISTPFDVCRPGSILFIEDVSEPIYKVERILYTLKLNGTLEKLAGLIVGRFTNYTGDRDNDTMEDMIQSMVAEYDYPVAYNVPIGHVDHNIPMLCSSTVSLNVTPTGTVIRTIA